MPGPIIRDTRPDWAKPETTSVLDSPQTKALRWLAWATGMDNPQSQLMSFATPMEVGPSGGLVGLVNKGLEKFGESEVGRGLYSRIDDLLSKIPGRGAHPNKIRSLISGGASAEESAYRKIPEFLASKGDQPVTREELAAHLAANPAPMPQVVTRGAPPPPDLVKAQDDLAHQINIYRAAAFDDPADWVGVSQVDRANAQWWAKEAAAGDTRALANLRHIAPDPDHLQTMLHYGKLANQSRVLNEQRLTIPAAKYQQYSLPGGENYREHLLTLPDPHEAEIARLNQQAQDLQFTGPEDQFYAAQDRLAAARQAAPPSYQSGHWDEPNILAHVRSTERTLPSGQPRSPAETLAALEQGVITPEETTQYRLGPGSRGRFLEEVQSDWHQAGKSQGYRGGDQKALAMAQDVAELRATEKAKQILQEQGFTPDFGDAREALTLRELQLPNLTGDAHAKLDQDLRELEGLIARRQDAWAAYERAVQGGVPDAPFKDTWPDLALKQQLLDVAHRPDLDWLGFTSGATQNARYDLSRRVGHLAYNPNAHQLFATDIHGMAMPVPVSVWPEDLPQHIGHEATQRLLSQPLDQYGEHVLTGQDLQIGGKGMQAFYDQLLPARLQKLLKPFGGTVEPFPVPGTGKPGQYAIMAAPPGTTEVRQLGPFWSTREEAASFRPSWMEYPGAHIREVEPPTPPDQGWLARLTPEMKAAIRAKGFPLLSLLPGAAAFAPAAMRAFSQRTADDYSPPPPPVEPPTTPPGAGGS